MTASTNIDDRASIERAYPLDRFREDANRNSIPNAPVLHGLTIVSPPDAGGAFQLRHAERQSGERDGDGYAAFVPAMGHAGDGDEAAYASFIDRVIEAARSLREVEPADGRLRGFHGG
jgi:hypothetical protein